MRKITLLLTLLNLSVCVFSQTPQAFKYQTVVRDANGNAYGNKIVALRISILQDNPLGNAVYVETHNTTTNDFGIVNLNIGLGTTVSGNFSNINWGADDYFVKTEIDINGGSNFQFMGTSQLLSVPYALFAAKSANAADDYDKDSTNELQIINKVGSNVTLSNNGGSFTDNDNQTLSLNGTQLYISNGNSVNVGGTVDLDWDPTNEIQNLMLNGSSLSISQGNSITLPPDADSDNTNELQTISKIGSTITLSNGGGSVTDNDNQNLSNTSNGTQRTINISGGAGTTINVADNDDDASNELQTLSYANDTLRLSQGNFVILPISQILPSGSCITTQNSIPPTGYSYSGNFFKTFDYWLDKSSLSTNRGESVAACVNNKIYVIGGSSSTNYSTSTVQEFDPILNTWSVKANLPNAITEASVAVINNKIYVIGGASPVTNIVQEYTPATDTWALKTSMPTARAELSAATVNGKIYVFGGFSSLGYHSEVEEYDPVNDSWTTKTSMITGRRNMVSVVLNNKIYAIGGDPYGTILEVYDPIADTWSTKQGLNTGRTDFAGGVINNKIIVIGGGTVKSVEEYDPLLNTWSYLTDIRFTGYSMSSTSYNNEIYIFGGIYNGSLSGICKVYKAPLTYFIHCKN